MKPKFRVLSLLLLVAMLLSITPLPVQVQAFGFPTEGDFRYDIYEGVLELKGYTGPGGAVTIPSTMGGYPVTYIGVAAFSECTSLTEVTIPSSVIHIYMMAFLDCTNLRSVTIPESVKGIAVDVFSGCENLQTVYYAGSQEQWRAIMLKRDDGIEEELKNATIVYNYVPQCDHNYTGTVTTEPTETTTGIKTYTCSACGYTYTETLPALFYGANIDMGNSLDLNFYFYKELVDSTGYVRFVREFADGTTETTTKFLSEFGFNGDYYQITYPGLAAMEMNDNVSVTVYDKDGNALSQTKTESLCSYIRRALDKITDPVSRTMYVDMLNYGAAAQLNFGYDTDNLANSILTEAEKAEGTQSIASLTNGYTRENTNYYGTNFDLESRINLNQYVLASAIGENGYAQITYTNFKGEDVTKNVTQYSANGDYYVFTPDFVVAADGRCLLNIQFCKADGTPVVTVTDSMESYVARAIEKDPEKYGWMEKMIAYSDSARAYLIANNR